MEYKIRNKKLYTRYRPLTFIKGEPYCVTSTKHPEPAAPIEKLHYHNMYEIGICTDGCGEYQVNDKLYRFKKGDIVFICHFIPHNSNSENGHPAKWKMIFFDPVKLMRRVGMLDTDQWSAIANADCLFSGIFAPDEHPRLTDFVKKIIELSETQDECTDLSIAFHVGSFIIECTRYLKTHSISDKPLAIDNKNYYKISPAIDMINSHMSNSKMVEEESLANLCKMSVSNLRRLFKTYTGFSPKAYINNARMTWAEYLVRETDMSIVKISNTIGYSEVAGFNRIFKATFGMSPKEYRNKVK